MSKGNPSSPQREKTFQKLIDSLQGNPAYIFLFGLGLLGGTTGLATAGYGAFQTVNELVYIGIGTWFVFLVFAFLTIRLVEKQRFSIVAMKAPTTTPMTPATLDSEAQEAFFAGTSADILKGRWKSTWHLEGQVHQDYYEHVQEEAQTNAEDYEEYIDITTDRARVSCKAFDPTTGKYWWLDGRLSVSNNVTLTYWSTPDSPHNELTGVIFFEINKSFEANRPMKLIGSWIAYTREGRGKISHGGVEWTKIG